MPDNERGVRKRGEKPKRVPNIRWTLLGLFLEPEVDTAAEAAAVEAVAEPTSVVQSVEEGTTDLQMHLNSVCGPHSLFEFHWGSFPNPPLNPEERREAFVGNAGPTIDCITNPYEIFSMIWDRSIIEHIVAQTNLYAQQYAAHLLDEGRICSTSRITKWVDTTPDEIFVYFALLLAMGLVTKASMEDYWQTDKLSVLYTPGFAVHMSYNRFSLLNRCIHFNNVSADTVSPSDAKIIKIKPIVDHLNKTFQHLYNLGQNVALDESLTQWKGRLNFKQFIPNKKAAVGIKSYEVCDSESGYLWRFEIHSGKDHQLPTEESIVDGRIPNLVLRLLQGLEGTGRTVWMDNYYNSPALARILKSRGLDCAGTLRTNRQFVPREIADLKQKEMMMGEICGCTSGDVDLMVWCDQNRVALISTYHGLAVSDDKPILVHDYNLRMGGVDKKDQMLSGYPMERKRTSIWYKKFFRRLLNASVLNAYVISKHFNPKIQHRSFREELIAQILKKYSKAKQPPPVVSLRLSSSKRPKIPEHCLHIPKLLPFTSGGQKERLRRVCVMCKTKRTRWICENCTVALCLEEKKNCFRQYHL